MFLSRLLAAAALAAIVAASPQGKRTPPTGWATWCTEGVCGHDVCTETEILDVAATLVATGLSKMYTTIKIDDCWAMDARDANGRLYPDPARFPSGMPHLITALHAMNFTVSLYTSLGNTTCNPSGHPKPIPGSYGSYDLDAATFASWGVDEMKGDWCGTYRLRQTNATLEMASAIAAAGPPANTSATQMGFNFHCGYYSYDYQTWCTQVGTYTRMYYDHFDWYDNWSVEYHIATVVSAVRMVGETNVSLTGGAQPGGGYWWPDMDYLQTGGQGCVNGSIGVHCAQQSCLEYHTEFSFWALWRSPLIFATDPRNLTECMADILLNQEIYAVNQDVSGVGAIRLRSDTCNSSSSAWDASAFTAPCELWHREQSDGAQIVLVWNPNNATSPAVNASYTVQFADVGVPAGSSVCVRDMWAHADVGVFTGSFTALDIQPHEAKVYNMTVC